MRAIARPFLARLWAALVLITLASASCAQSTAPDLVAGATAAITSHTEVQTGAYVLRLTNVSPRDGSFDVDMWLWFRWKGADVRPDLSFELANGIINSRSDSRVEDDGGVNYASIRVQATIFQDFDVRRFPLDNHILTIDVEDADLNDTQLTYVADTGTALDPAVKVSGWKVSLPAPRIETHVYDTTYGQRAFAAAGGTYSRFVLPISLERTSYGPLLKSFWISALAVLLGLLACLIKADDLDARFGMGVGSIFAASANAFVITDGLPPTTAVTLAEQINFIAVGIIFVSVFVSIWSLRLRYNGRNDASLTLDRRAMWTLGAIYVVLNTLALMFDFSGGTG